MKKISLKNVREILTNNEMKNVRGGCGAYGGGTCHCMNGETKDVTSCSREACEKVCDGPVQNCNYVA